MGRRALFAGAALVVGTIGAGGIATAHGSHDRFQVRMRSIDEVTQTPIVDRDGRGTAKLDIDTKSNEICWSVRFDNTGTPNRGHIHSGAKGVNGGIVVPLFELVGMPDDVRNDALEKGHLDGCVEGVDPTLVADIVAHPDAYYVNLHNARYPGGAMRGQVG